METVFLFVVFVHGYTEIPNYKNIGQFTSVANCQAAAAALRAATLEVSNRAHTRFVCAKT